MPSMVLQSGSLSESTFIDLVADTRAAADEAILEVARSAGSRSFFFRERKLVALVTSSPGESFTAMLVRRRKVQRSVAESIEQVAQADGVFHQLRSALEIELAYDVATVSLD